MAEGEGGAGKGNLKFLSTQMGPFPIGVWILIVVAGGIAGFVIIPRLFGSSSTPASSTDTTGTTTDTTGASPNGPNAATSAALPTPIGQSVLGDLSSIPGLSVAGTSTPGACPDGYTWDSYLNVCIATQPVSAPAAATTPTTSDTPSQTTTPAPQSNPTAPASVPAPIPTVVPKGTSGYSDNFWVATTRTGETFAQFIARVAPNAQPASWFSTYRNNSGILNYYAAGGNINAPLPGGIAFSL